MIRDLGIVPPGSVLYLPFHTFDSNDPTASVTMTGLATTDIEIYKDGSVTQRASDAGYALLDTDGIDFDAITGIHGISIDLADNTTAGFYAAGSQYWVVLSSITVDAATINFVLCTFRIGQPAAILNTTIATLASQTSFTLTVGPAEDDALNGCLVRIHDVASAVQSGFGVVSDYTGATKTVTLAAGVTFTAAATDNISVFPPALLPTTAGRTLDVSATGEAGVDWANVGTPGSTVSLSATTVATVTTTATATAVTTVNGLAANVITAASIAMGAIDADAIADNAIDAGAIATGAITAAKFAAGAIDAAAIADAAIDAATFAAGAINAAAIAADAITDAKVASDVTIASVTGAVGSVTAAVTLPTIPTAWITADGIAADAIGASELAADAVAEIADAIWDEATSGHVASGSFGQALFPIRANTAQAGANGSITLDASASAVDDFYKNSLIVVTGGTGANQVRTISGYTGSTKVATITPNWGTNPDVTSVFVILPNGAIAGASAPTAGEVADAVWDEARAGHVSAGSFGEYVLADATRISGDATAADNAELFFDGTGYNAANSTVGTVTLVTTTTTLTNLPTIPANWLTAAGTAADFGTEVGTAVWASGTRTVTSLSGLTVDTVTTLTNLPAITSNWLTAAGLAADAGVEIAAAVWDRVLNAANHNIASSAGRRLRQLDASSILSGTAAAGAANSITLDGSASATDEIYDDNLIVITGGTGAGQTRIIVEYNGTTKVAIVNRAWQTNPSTDSTYDVIAGAQGLIAQHGLAQGGTASTITLASTASAVDDIYIGSQVFISTSTGSGQTRLITDYVGSTKVATVSPDWVTNPTSASVYNIIPIGRAIVDSGTVTTLTNLPAITANWLTATGIAADAITAAKIATGAIDADAIAADAVTEIQAGLATPTNITAGTMTTVTNLTNLPAITSNWLTAAGLATDAVSEIVTAVLTTAMTESYNADGSPPTVAQALHVIMQALTEMAISGTTTTVKKLDGTTTAFTLTLNSATTPTSVTRAT